MRIWGFIIAACCVFGAAPASAAVLTIQMTFKLAQVSGANGSGLNGATVVFNAAFADGATFGLICCGQPQVAATSNSFVISGATNAASNGTFSDPAGISIFPNNSPDGIFATTGQFLSIGGFITGASITRTMSNVVAGQPLTLAFLQTAFGGALTGGDRWVASDGGRYRLTDVVTQVEELDPEPPAVVPLPATLPLFLAGLGALAAARRKKIAA